MFKIVYYAHKHYHVKYFLSELNMLTWLDKHPVALPQLYKRMRLVKMVEYLPC